MITPSFGLTATERVLPRLALDFTTATLDPRITFTRSGNTGTIIDSSGVIVGINADLPRFDYDPETLVCRGLLIEESRTNALLNSLIDGTSLVTQSVTVTAAARTLSFYGTGQIVLSGAASATVTGIGAYPTRTTYTFTPSAGSLTFTVTGTVQFAQLELGSFATSFIPTAGAAVTRNADVATMTGTNFSDWYNATEGAIQAEFSFVGYSTANRDRIVSISNSTGTSEIVILQQTTNGYGRFEVVNSGSNQALLDCINTTMVAGTTYKICGAYKANSFVASGSLGSQATDSSGTVPTVDRMCIGGFVDGTATLVFSGHMRKINYWPQRITNNETRAFAK